jgi:hypothetical protein
MRVVVLDIDETLGAFTAFSAFLQGISPYLISFELFSQMLDQHPSFLRPGILEFLTYLNSNRRINLCRVVLYTNNASSEWVALIANYFSNKIDKDLFSAVIHGAHPKRQRADGLVKSVADLTECIKVNRDTQFLFVDDLYHHGMVHPAVMVYVQLKPYTHPRACPVEATQKMQKVVSTYLQQPIS